ncbi:MAG TPA: hypothetical protein VFD06_00495, partial [Candidatus Polarisedimenticolia bacterium]|nr:hypothetical protein [Candidatus Polarisedimenticolia bacterium]
MSRQPTMPLLAQWLLSRVLPVRLRESILGDLEEERRALGGGTTWLWAQALGIAARYGWERASRVARRPRQSERQSASGARQFGYGASKGDG